MFCPYFLYPGVPAQRQFDCLDCPGGFWCAKGTIDPSSCGMGFYSEPGKVDCKTCIIGSVLKSYSMKIKNKVLKYYNWSLKYLLSSEPF